MGRRLAGTGGRACRAALTLLLVCLLAACGAEKPAAPAGNDTDVMFLQMGLAQITEGDRVAELAEARAA
ncbi:hypothetical protein AB0C31_46555, partial [Actinoplanes philippinensis]